jgi:hypothetical protein
LEHDVGELRNVGAAQMHAEWLFDPAIDVEPMGHSTLAPFAQYLLAGHTSHLQPAGDSASTTCTYPAVHSQMLDELGSELSGQVHCDEEMAPMEV